MNTPQKSNVPPANKVTAGDKAKIDTNITQEDNNIDQPQPQKIDVNATYKFGDEEVSGDKLQNWASLGKLDTSERVQGERDRYKQQYESLLTEKAQREVALSQYKTQAEMTAKQLEQVQSLLPQQEEQKSALDQLFDQYEQPQPATQQQYMEESQAQARQNDFVTILRQALQAQQQDTQKLIDSRLGEVDSKLQQVPSREDVQNIQNTFTQQQEAEQRQRQAHLLTNQAMQEVENRLVQQRGWTQEQAHDFSLLREQITQMSKGLDVPTANPQDFANLYAQVQTLDTQSEELKEKFDTEVQSKRQSEQDVAMSPTTFQPVNRVVRPEENESAPKYVTTKEYRGDLHKQAMDILHKHKVVG